MIKYKILETNRDKISRRDHQGKVNSYLKWIEKDFVILNLDSHEQRFNTLQITSVFMELKPRDKGKS